MDIYNFLGPGKTGVFYGIEHYEGLSLEEQLLKAEDLTERNNSIIIEKYIDVKTELILKDISYTRGALMEMMRSCVANNCDYIISYEKKCLYSSSKEKRNLDVFLMANQIPVILCKEESLWGPIINPRN